MPSTATARFRPLVPVAVFGPSGNSLAFERALVDPGADDTIFHLDVAAALGIPLLVDAGHGMRWRGQQFRLRFGFVDLELADDSGNTLRWPATIAFTMAKVRYPLLGVSGCLEFFDARFLGQARIVELEPNPLFP